MDCGRIKEKDTAEGKTVDEKTTAVRDIYRYEKGVLTKTAGICYARLHA